MQVIDGTTRFKDIYKDSLTNRKRMEMTMQRYARFDMFPCRKSIWFVFSSRLVDIRPQSALPPPLSPSVDIQPEYLINSSPSPSSNSQSLSLYLGENSKLLFRSSPSPRESVTSSTSDKAILMTGSQQSSVVQPLLTDLYQISMAYAYWKSNKHQEIATFDLYFRKNRKFIINSFF
jgi:hypothetical protein